MRTIDYDDFYRHYRPFVAAYVQRRAAADDVADLVADVFATAWRRRDDVPDDALPWLYRTARNVVGTRYRSSSRAASLREKLGSVPPERGIDPADIAADRDVLMRALESLSEDDRELLLLTAWEGLDSTEIAEVLGIKANACAVRLHRARNRLEKAMVDGRYSDEQLDDGLVDISTIGRTLKERNS